MISRSHHFTPLYLSLFSSNKATICIINSLSFHVPSFSIFGKRMLSFSFYHLMCLQIYTQYNIIFFVLCHIYIEVHTSFSYDHVRHHCPLRTCHITTIVIIPTTSNLSSSTAIYIYIYLKILFFHTLYCVIKRNRRLN